MDLLNTHLADAQVVPHPSLLHLCNTAVTICTSVTSAAPAAYLIADGDSAKAARIQKGNSIGGADAACRVGGWVGGGPLVHRKVNKDNKSSRDSVLHKVP